MPDTVATRPEDMAQVQTIPNYSSSKHCSVRHNQTIQGKQKFAGPTYDLSSY